MHVATVPIVSAFSVCGDEPLPSVNKKMPAASKSALVLLVRDRVERNAVGLRGARRRRLATAANVRTSAGTRTHIGAMGIVGLRTAALFETNDSTEEVAEFLRELNLSVYIASFRAHAVTGSVLLSLTSAELRDALGVAKLKDRRIVMDAIAYLKEQIDPMRCYVLPEDGRILTHLSNEVTVLAWYRFGVVMMTMGAASLRLVNLKTELNKSHVVILSSILAVLSAGAVIQAFYRYYWMHRMIESPGLDFEPDDIVMITPGVFLPALALLFTYGIMANETEEAAILALLSV